MHDTLNHLVLFASYNRWMNDKLYTVAATLPEVELRRERQAFFGSILGTLQHIVIADTLWLSRFAAHPAGYAALAPLRAMAAPTSLDQPLPADFAELAAQRKRLDDVITAWIGELQPDDLKNVLSYRNTKGIAGNRLFGDVLLHFFNHQTHHRGQVTTLLTQAGAEVGLTDLLALVPNLGAI